MTWQVLIRYFSSSHFIVGWSWDIYNAKCNFIGWIDSFPLVTHELGKTWKFWYILRDLLYNKLSHVIGKGQILLIPLVNFWILILISVHHVPSCKRIDFSFKKKNIFSVLNKRNFWSFSFLDVVVLVLCLFQYSKLQYLYHTFWKVYVFLEILYFSHCSCERKVYIVRIN